MIFMQKLSISSKSGGPPSLPGAVPQGSYWNPCNDHDLITTFSASKLQSVRMSHAKNKRSRYQHLSALYLCRVPQWKFSHSRISDVKSRFVILKVITLSYSYVTRSGHFTSQGLLDHSGRILRPHKALAWVFSWLLKIETKIAKSI